MLHAGEKNALELSGLATTSAGGDALLEKRSSTQKMKYYTN